MCEGVRKELSTQTNLEKSIMDKAVKEKGKCWKMRQRTSIGCDNLFLERGEGREKERKKNINMREKHQSVASCTRPKQNQTRNAGMCPDQKSNPQRFALWKTPNQVNHTGPGREIRNEKRMF